MLDMGDLFSWINGIYAKCIKNLSNETISISNFAQNKRIKSYNRKLKTRSGLFYQNFSDLLWEKNVQVIKKIFWDD